MLADTSASELIIVAISMNLVSTGKLLDIFDDGIDRDPE